MTTTKPTDSGECPYCHRAISRPAGPLDVCASCGRTIDVEHSSRTEGCPTAVTEASSLFKDELEAGSCTSVVKVYLWGVILPFSYFAFILTLILVKGGDQSLGPLLRSQNYQMYMLFLFIIQHAVLVTNRKTISEAFALGNVIAMFSFLISGCILFYLILRQIR